MQTRLFLVAFLLAAVTASARDWETDFAKATEAAKAGDKVMLLDFTGSDWCGWCKRLDKEIFAKKEFKEFAKDKLVCVELDFPQQKAQSSKLKKQNAALQNKYGVRGYPTLVLLSPDGEKEIGRPANRLNGPGPFIAEVEGLIASWRAKDPSAKTAK